MDSGLFDGWHDDFERKVMSADEAAKFVTSGCTIGVPATASTPTLGAAIMRRADNVADVHVTVCAPVMDPGWFTPGHPNLTVHVETFQTAVSRKAYYEGRTGFASIMLSRRFKAADERGADIRPLDVTLISVSPPDRWGYCSFGLGMWNKLNFAKHAKMVIAEVSAAHPRTHGTNRIHVSEIDAFVVDLDPPGANPMMGGAPPAALDPNIVDAVASLVHDGDTFQIGTGGLTNLLPLSGTFDHHRDLGYHAELSVPGLNTLVRKGVINGSRKNLHRGKYVATSLIATTQDEIDFITDNPMYEVYEVEYTNDPLVIGAHDNMVAINNALAVDLTGQVTAESIDGRIFSGPGGQPEFVMGAMLSKGGRSITLLDATARGGTVSRVMPFLPQGTTVTVPKYLADYVVTEFGVASLFGKSERERADELIAIAHPDHRAELRRAAAAMI